MLSSLLKRIKVGFGIPLDVPDYVREDQIKGKILREKSFRNQLPIHKRSGFVPTGRPSDSNSQGGLNCANRYRLAVYHEWLTHRIDLTDHYNRVSRGMALKDKWRSRIQNKGRVQFISNVVKLNYVGKPKSS